MLVPLALFLGAAIDLEIDRLFVESNVGDLYAVTELGGGTVSLGKLVEAVVMGSDFALGGNDDVLVRQRHGFAHPHEFGIDELHEFQPGAVRQFGTFIKVRRRRGCGWRGLVEILLLGILRLTLGRRESRWSHYQS